MIDGENFFPANLKWYKNIRQKFDKLPLMDDCTTGSLLDYYYFNKHYEMIAIYLSKQQAIRHSNWKTIQNKPKPIEPTNFTRNLGDANNRVMLFIIEEAKETISDFSQKKTLWMSPYDLRLRIVNVTLRLRRMSYRNNQS